LHVETRAERGSSFKVRTSNTVGHCQKADGRQLKAKKEMSTSTVNISAGQVKELREKTGAPMGDCKNA
jgi:hypothetical protein